MSTSDAFGGGTGGGDEVVVLAVVVVVLPCVPVTAWPAPSVATQRDADWHPTP